MYNKHPRVYLASCPDAVDNCIAAASTTIPDAEICATTIPDANLAAKADLVLCPADAGIITQLHVAKNKDADLIALADRDAPCTHLLADIWPADAERLRFHFQRWLDRFSEKRDLQEKSYFLERVLATTPNMVWFKDKNGIHELVNDSFCAVVGKTREQAEGRSHAYIWNVDADDPACIESERIVMESGLLHQTEEEISTGEGKRLLAVRKAPLCDRDGSMMGTVGMAMDITSEREYQQKLIHNNAMLETLFATMDCGMLCQSLDGSRVITANQAALNLLGYKSVAELQKNFKMVAETVVDEDKPILRRAIGHLQAPGDSSSYEYRVRHPDGRIFHIIGNARLVEKDGELICRRFLLDCTEQKLADEKNRREAEKRQNELIRALSVDFQLVFIRSGAKVNQILQLLPGPDEELKRIFATSAPLDQKIGEYIATCVHPDDRDACAKAFSVPYLSEKLAGEKTFNFNYRALHNGETHYFAMRAIAAGEDKDSFGIVVGLQSVDEAIRSELEQKSILAEALKQAQRANSAKSIFLSNMSHDIRTPLNAVLGYARLAENRLDKPDAVAGYLEKIRNSGSHLISLINDILDMSHIESGRIQLDEALCNLPELLGELVALVQPDADRKNQTLRIEIAPLANPDIYCDKLRLKQVILNLLSNAVKYTGENGSILLEARQIQSGDGSASYELKVSDNGIGMEAGFLGQIFEPFERANNVGSIQGTGLGMAITKSIVDLMKGQITVESEPDKGTTFNLQLAFRTPVEAVAPTGRSHGEEHSVHHAGARLLLAEDNDMNQEIASEILREAGYEVEIANNGKEALELLEHNQDFAVILMDVQMPVMDGYEATSRIRNLPDARLAQIPIIAMTANSFEEDRQEALNRGMNAHIAKPINFPELFATLDHFLEKGDK